MKALLLGSFILGGLLATTPVAMSQTAPPDTEQARKVETLVNEAAALVEKNGKAAFAEFKKKDSKWFHGDIYIFSYDMNATVLLNAAFPEREGRNMTGQKDVKGKPFHDEIIHIAQTKGSGWIDLMMLRPGRTEPVLKWAFVRRVTIDSTPGVIGSGFYPD